MRDNLASIQKVNKHLGIALAELTNNPGVYPGVLREQRKLIKLKLKLENIIEIISREETRAKKRVFDRIKR